MTRCSFTLVSYWTCRLSTWVTTGLDIYRSPSASSPGWCQTKLTNDARLYARLEVLLNYTTTHNYSEWYEFRLNTYYIYSVW
ncbi:hypothetical protein F4824DRAFT_444455 [Ustulina deusta]|nr:hypothetical protein F4824DRAFT_444455 [Ustulina deusta]